MNGRIGDQSPGNSLPPHLILKSFLFEPCLVQVFFFFFLMALFLEAVLITVQYYVFFLQLYLWRKSIPLAAKYQLLFFFFLMEEVAVHKFSTFALLLL